MSKTGTQPAADHLYAAGDDSQQATAAFLRMMDMAERMDADEWIGRVIKRNGVRDLAPPIITPSNKCRHAALLIAKKTLRAGDRAIIEVFDSVRTRWAWAVEMKSADEVSIDYAADDE